MQKESLLLAENLEVVDVLLGKKSQKNSELLIIMIQRRKPLPFARTSEG